MRKFFASMTLGVAVAAAAAGVAPSSSSAADYVSGCFRYYGVPYRNLSVNLEYRTTSGTFKYLGGKTRSSNSGCASLRIYGSWRNYQVRMRATGVVSGGRGILDGSTPYYAAYTTGSYRLGTARLRGYFLPTSVAPAPFSQGSTGSWLDDMDNLTGSAGCSSTTAMMVACYMDRHGLTGNVVAKSVADQDRDGWYDVNDRYPVDPTRY